jgi:biopolymer transport protein ExbB
MLESLVTIFLRGGIMMIPLAGCSFVVLLVTLERGFVLRRRRLIDNRVFERWRAWLAATGDETRPPPAPGPAVISRILYPLTDVFPLPRARFEERVADLARAQRHQMARGMVLLETIAGIAPLFGLLGTALGMVEVFSQLSVVEDAKMSALSAGISQALFTTVAGLFIGIPALVAHNLFSRHIDNLMLAAEVQLNSLIDRYYSRLIRA